MDARSGSRGSITVHHKSGKGRDQCGAALICITGTHGTWWVIEPTDADWTTVIDLKQTFLSLLYVVDA